MNLIERLRKLEKEATPGPWSNDARNIYYEYDGLICSNVRAYGDTELIAETRNALPLLLDVVEAAKQCKQNASHVKGAPAIVDSENWEPFIEALQKLEGGEIHGAEEE